VTVAEIGIIGFVLDCLAPSNDTSGLPTGNVKSVAIERRAL